MRPRYLVLGLIAWASWHGEPIPGSEPTGLWSVRPLTRPALPSPPPHGWGTNPVDAFVQAAWGARGLSPAPSTPRATLTRRLSLDLLGLPPDVPVAEMAREFAPGEYERLVDRLLASPHFGERLAVSWLDAARYADTHGFLIDAHRDMWRWRDWVIEAFNANQPFDQFTIEQLAGDLLPNPTLSQQIATGFNRNHMINYENGADPEEYRVEYVADRAATTANVWLGMTFQCARCHDHKYDRVSQREYYRWFAFFNQVAEAGLDGNLGNAPPVLAAPTRLQQEDLSKLEQRMSALQAHLETLRQTAWQNRGTWEPQLRAARRTMPAPADTAIHLPCDESVAESSDHVFVPGRRGSALRCAGDTFLEIPAPRWPTPATGFTWAAWLFLTTSDDMVVLEQANSQGHPLVRWEIRAGVPHWWVRNAPPTVNAPAERPPPAATPPPQRLPLRQWHHLAVTWDGTADSAAVWHWNGEPFPAPAAARILGLAPGGRWTVGGAPGVEGVRGLLDDVRCYLRPLNREELGALAESDPVTVALAVPPENRTAEQKRLLSDRFLRESNASYRQTEQELTTLRESAAALRRRIPTTMVMRDLAQPRPTSVLRRGRFDLPGELVTPGVPEMLAPWPAELPANRLGLARWLIGPARPLVARVQVNRLWQLLFGAGLVRTPDDLGSRGELPTHPELLDWLASELVDSGWDLKHLVRLMVTSATYRQSSTAAPESLERDPENRWWARASRGRLEAEQIRDGLLATSGLLDVRLGGPSVFPYQPPGLWEEVSFNPVEYTAQTYLPSHGADLYRRGLYTFWKRTLPPPTLAIFDAPTRETCQNSRMRTMTAVQALVVMNETTSWEAARNLVERTGPPAEASVALRVARMIEIVLGRTATPREVTELTSLWERQRLRWAAQPQAAEQLLATGESPRDRRWNPVDLAAGACVANVLYCLDEGLHRN